MFANSRFEPLAAEFPKVGGDMFRQTMLSERDSDPDEAGPRFCAFWFWEGVDFVISKKRDCQAFLHL